MYKIQIITLYSLAISFQFQFEFQFSTLISQILISIPKNSTQNYPNNKNQSPKSIFYPSSSLCCQTSHKKEKNKAKKSFFSSKKKIFKKQKTKTKTKLKKKINLNLSDTCSIFSPSKLKKTKSYFFDIPKSE